MLLLSHFPHLIETFCSQLRLHTLLLPRAKIHLYLSPSKPSRVTDALLSYALSAYDPSFDGSIWNNYTLPRLGRAAWAHFGRCNSNGWGAQLFSRPGILCDRMIRLVAAYSTWTYVVLTLWLTIASNPTHRLQDILCSCRRKWSFVLLLVCLFATLSTMRLRLTYLA